MTFQFRSAIGTLNIKLSPTEIQDLVDKYMLPSGLVNYQSLCDNVNQVFSETADTNKILNQSATKCTFTEQEANSLYGIMKELRGLITSNRILMKPSFQDFDPARTCHITAQQFGRVLKGLSLMPSDDIFELICKNYFDKNNTRDVNYLKFCQDVDKPEDMFPSLEFEKKKEEAKVVAGTIIETKSNFFNKSTRGIDIL